MVSGSCESPFLRKRDHLFILQESEHELLKTERSWSRPLVTQLDSSVCVCLLFFQQCSKCKHGESFICVSYPLGAIIYLKRKSLIRTKKDAFAGNSMHEFCLSF